MITERITLRNGTASAWSTANPVLALGEQGYETDTKKIKIGDGVTAWNSLAYHSSGEGSGLTADQATLLGTAEELETTAKTLPGAVNELKAENVNLWNDVRIPIVEQTADTVAINPNCFNVWGQMARLTITLNPPKDATRYNEYFIQFTSGATATTLAMPSTIKWMQEPAIEANKTYQISIVDNIAVIGGA